MAEILLSVVFHQNNLRFVPCIQIMNYLRISESAAEKKWLYCEILNVLLRWLNQTMYISVFFVVLEFKHSEGLRSSGHSLFSSITVCQIYDVIEGAGALQTDLLQSVPGIH